MIRIFLLTLVCTNLCLTQAVSLADDNSTASGGMQISQMTNEVVLFNFDDNTVLSTWRVVNDTVMGGVSSSRMETSEDGKALFTGNVSLKNRGGFASVRGPRIKQSLGKFEGIAIRVKGDGKRYKCGLRTDDAFDAIFHQAPFETKIGEWQLVKIPFTDFVPTYHGRRLSDDKRMKRQDIRSVSFLIADKQKGSFRLEIDWIKAYR
jgi:NADH dehydrogenase [ubiquinone] 1 alpha subcomplex assembly factor 1